MLRVRRGFLPLYSPFFSFFFLYFTPTRGLYLAFGDECVPSEQRIFKRRDVYFVAYYYLYNYSN
jgi:hypothetical protein